MFDAIIVSDIHLGSSNCQAKSLCKFLDHLVEKEITTARLILNGDVFDSIDFRRLSKNHWKVLSRIRKLADKFEIIWICGNHDGSAEVISHLLGVTVKDEFVLESGGRKILVLHGHTFDDFIDVHPFLTWVGDCIYLLLQRIDRTHYFAKLAKKGSKTFVRCVQKIRQGSIEYARKKRCDAVCCGHTHLAASDGDDQLPYFNSGCWTEVPSTYLTVQAGQIQLHSFEIDPVEIYDEEQDTIALPMRA